MLLLRVSINSQTLNVNYPFFIDWSLILIPSQMALNAKLYIFNWLFRAYMKQHLDKYLVVHLKTALRNTFRRSFIEKRCPFQMLSLPVQYYE